MTWMVTQKRNTFLCCFMFELLLCIALCEPFVIAVYTCGDSSTTHCYQTKSTELAKAMENPRVYSANNKLQRNIIPIIEEFSEELVRKCGKCADIGCGPGDITRNILLPSLGSNAQITGLDICPTMIKYANETCSDEKCLHFEVLDIQTTNLPKKYISEFNHIFSFHTLHWCNDIRQALNNIYQMLRPNGTMLLHMIASHDVYEILETLTLDIRFAKYMLNMKNIAPYQESKNARKELKELLQSIGFTVHHCSLRERSHSDDKSQSFLKSIISILTFSEDMPYELMEEFKNVFTCEFMRRKIKYKSMYNDEELTLDLFKVLLVYAQKIV